MRFASVALLGAALIALAPALAHGPADWIMQGQHKNTAGEWCCGEADCFVVTGVATVTTPAPGYRLKGSILEDGRERPDDKDGRERPDDKDGRERPDDKDGRERPDDNEFIPQSEAQPSPDGQFWRCKRPDGSRRCFFAPPPNS